MKTALVRSILKLLLVSDTPSCRVPQQGYGFIQSRVIARALSKPYAYCDDKIRRVALLGAISRFIRIEIAGSQS
jgi:hypothetical protein